MRPESVRWPAGEYQNGKSIAYSGVHYTYQGVSGSELAPYLMVTRSISQGHCLCETHLEDGGSMDLRNVGILSQHYMASQPRTPRLES